MNASHSVDNGNIYRDQELRIALEAFGPDNLGAFQSLLNAATSPDKLAGGG